MEKLLGILPYLYFEEPIQLGEVTFIGVPNWQGRDLMPSSEADRKSLHELSMCFFPHWGFRTEKGSIKATTYFLLDGTKMAEQELFKACQKAITLLRYALLRPDNQAISDIESTYLYLFALPPVGSGQYRVYRGWQNMNQELWVSPKDDRSIYPPDWGVSMREVNTSQLEDIDVIKDCFYDGKISDERQSEVLLAMEWYNQSFQKYSIHNVAGRLVDISIAFEALFQLQKNNITLKEAVKKALDVSDGSLLERWAGAFYGGVRSATQHSGKPASLLFKHPEADTPHLSFSWSAQRIFRECLAAEIGLPRHILNDWLIQELIPNEVLLSNLRRAGSFGKILEGGLLGEIGKLRQIYPAGKRKDIIWLGKELLRAYKGKFLVNEEQSLPTLDLILSAKDDDNELGLLYYQFSQEFRPLAHKYVTVFWGEVSESELKKPMPITSGNFEQFQLESAIYHFAEFAGWALLIPA